MSANREAGGEITRLLQVWSGGDEVAFEQLIPLVYDELHRMALRYLAGERSTVSLQATALVSEVCLRLLGWDQVHWQNRGHFFGASAQMMRRVLVDIARRRADRRGGTRAVRVPLEGIDVAAVEPDADLVAINEALEKWRRRIPARPVSSNCASSAACRWRKRRRRSASPCGRRTLTGRLLVPGCTGP